jgi:hypothetical protein
MLKNRKPSPITRQTQQPPQTNEKPPTQTKKQETKTRNKRTIFPVITAYQ